MSQGEMDEEERSMIREEDQARKEGVRYARKVSNSGGWCSLVLALLASLTLLIGGSLYQLIL